MWTLGNIRSIGQFDQRENYCVVKSILINKLGAFPAAEMKVPRLTKEIQRVIERG